MAVSIFIDVANLLTFDSWGKSSCFGMPVLSIQTNRLRYHPHVYSLNLRRDYRWGYFSSKARENLQPRGGVYAFEQ
jgi:hypothetical protein